MTLSPRISRRFAAALMVTSSLTFAGMALSAPANAQSAEESRAAFEASDYTYCDAKLIAAGIAESVEGGKIRIGSKILNGTAASQMPGRLASARGYASCTWEDTLHSVEDAQRLAAVWGLASTGEAKTKIATLYTQGRSAEVLADLQTAGGGEMSAEDQAAWNAFQDSDYTYCDAKLLGAAWSVDVDRAKTEIGNKILGGMSENLPDIFAQGRRTTSCAFEDTQLTFEDAAKLAGVWDVDVTKAKDMAAAYYTNGQSAMVLSALAQTPPTKPITEEPPPQERSQ